MRTSNSAPALLRWVAYLTGLAVYALIVLGAIVRITGSGMGCGDDWPLCNGRLFPPLDDLPTLIEWTHRLAAAGVSALVIALALLAWAYRHRPAVAGSGGPLRPALLAAALLGVQVFLGAVTVWLVLPPAMVTVHLATALALLATVLVVALRAGKPRPPARTDATLRGASAALVLAALTLLLGGLTAGSHAGFACQGFPLCSGRLWPSTESGLAEIQWVHRLAAYGLVLHLAGFAIRLTRRGERADLKHLGWLALGTALLQVGVAVIMVTRSLPTEWRALHAAFGTLVWVAIAWIGARASPWAAGRALAPADTSSVRS